MRSSMPPACEEETSSCETGWASRRASAVSACIAIPTSLSALSARPGSLAEPLGQAGVRRVQELGRPLARARQRRREGEPGEVERSGQRNHLEVPDRDDDALLDDHERVRLCGVELDRELLGHEAERVARGAVHLGKRPEGERVLERPRQPLTAGDERTEPLERRAHARVGARVRDRGVEERAVGAERFEVEGAGDVERVQETDRVVHRERPPAGGEGALVEQRDRLALDELEVAEEAVRQVGHRGEVALADRAADADVGQLVRVEHRDEPLGEGGAGDGRPLRERVRKPQRLGADDVAWSNGTMAHQVLTQHEPVVIRGVDRRVPADPEAGREAVRGAAALENLLRHAAGSRHPLERPRCELDRLERTGDPDDLLELQIGAGQRDGHRACIIALGGALCTGRAAAASEGSRPSSLRTDMRAVVFTGAGGNEVVRLDERPDPEPTGDEVLLAVRFAGLNPADLAQRAGRYPAPPGSPPTSPASRRRAPCWPAGARHGVSRPARGSSESSAAAASPTA